MGLKRAMGLLLTTPLAAPIVFAVTAAPASAHSNAARCEAGGAQKAVATAKLRSQQLQDTAIVI